ncbi:MAG: SPOR domain-containing protein [Alphaproteobacteria bacterium]
MMDGISSPEETMVGGEEGGPTSASRRCAPSTLGLAVVSVLNALCLAFVLYHLAHHPAQSARAPVLPPVAAGAVPAAPAVERQQASLILRPGNIDFAPMSPSVVTLASGIDAAEGSFTGRDEQGPPEMVAATPSPPAAPSREARTLQHWVQLGALSNEATARRFWSRLEERHATLLEGRAPRILGPADVGGSLHHLRVGPMTEEGAAGLCAELKAEGVDCFCIPPVHKGVS